MAGKAETAKRETAKAEVVKAGKKADLSAKVISAVAAMIATFLARKVVTFAWTKATGKEPPAHPEDPDVALPEALGWSMLTGVIVGAAKLLATRAAARRTHGNPDSDPATATDA